MSTTPLIGENVSGVDFKTDGNDDVVRSDGSGDIRYRDGWQESNIQLVLISSAILVFDKDTGTEGSNSSGSARANLSLSSIVGASSTRDSETLGAGSEEYVESVGKEMNVYQYEDSRNAERVCWNLCRCDSNSRMRRKRKHVFVFPTVQLCREWTDQINASIGISNTSRRKFLVFLNPVSGPGQSQYLYDSVIKGMLEEAHIESTLIVTERQNHAYDVCAGTHNQSLLPLQQYSVIMVIGGDGLLYEVINGLAQRTPDGMSLLQQIPIAPIPGGTGNGLAKSVLFECDDEPFSLQSSVFVAIKGVPSPLDLSVVNTRSKTMYSFLSMSWGLISDVDIGSEPLRWMGEARLHLAAVYYILSRRFYAGRLLMELVDDNASDTEREIIPSLNVATDVEEARSAGSTIPTNIFPREEDFLAKTSKRKLKIIEGKFQLIWVLQTPYAAATVYSGPGAQLDDGAFTILVVQDMSTVQLLQLLIDIDTGAHMKAPGVQVYKATAYRLEPFAVSADKNDNQDYRGILVLDGESIDGPRVGPIQSKVLPNAARILKLPSSPSS